MQTINGFVVIADKPRSSTDRVILAAAQRPRGYEYVTAVWDGTAPEWVWGHYFTDIDGAVADFNDR